MEGFVVKSSKTTAWKDLDRAVIRTRRHQRVPRRLRVERRTSQRFVVIFERAMGLLPQIQVVPAQPQISRTNNTMVPTGMDGQTGATCIPIATS